MSMMLNHHRGRKAIQMRTPNTRLVLVMTAVSILGLALAGNAAAVTGTNPVLDAHGGNFYIPLKSSTSGTLGDSIPGPPSGDHVGLQSDSVTMYGDGDTGGGFVAFVLSFDLSGELGAGEEVCCDSLDLTLTLRDIDFKPYNEGWFNFRETLEITFLRDATDAPGAADLALDSTNYGTYAEGGFVETNNKTVTYHLNLMDDLGMTPEDCADINTDKEFGLYLVFRTELEHLRRNYCGDKISNTCEGMSNSLEFCSVPEPSALGGIAFGFTTLMFLLKRRKHA
jgi:hypothetical protein